jgi:predicted site-specific integrase-resolvase
MAPESGRAPTLDIPNRLLTRKETANLLGCSVAALRRWDRLGSGVRVTRLGSLIRYSPESIRAFVQRNSQSEEKAL